MIENIVKTWHTACSNGPDRTRGDCIDSMAFRAKMARQFSRPAFKSGFGHRHDSIIRNKPICCRIRECNRRRAWVKIRQCMFQAPLQRIRRNRHSGINVAVFNKKYWPVETSTRCETNSMNQNVCFLTRMFFLKCFKKFSGRGVFCHIKRIETPDLR